MLQPRRKAQATKFYRPSRARKQNSARILVRFVELANLLSPEEQIPEPWEMRTTAPDGKLWDFYRKFHRLLAPIRKRFSTAVIRAALMRMGSPLFARPLWSPTAGLIGDWSIIRFRCWRQALPGPNQHRVSMAPMSYFTQFARLWMNWSTRTGRAAGSIWIPCGYRRFDRNPRRLDRTGGGRFQRCVCSGPGRR